MTGYAVPTAVLAASLCAPAVAQPAIEGIYLKSPELCEEAQAGGIEAVLEQGEVLLTGRGFEGYEFNCEFLQSIPATRSPGWVVTALCEEPGYAYPEILAFMPRGEGILEVTAPLIGDGDGTTANTGQYQLCEGAELP